MNAERKLAVMALVVLGAWSRGRTPVPADVETLRIAFPASAHLPLDELACQVVHDCSDRMLRERNRNDEANR